MVRKPEEGVGEHAGSLVHLASPGLPQVYTPVAHHNCSHNQLVAAVNRVCGKVPHPTPGGLERLRRAARRLGRCLPETGVDEWGEFCKNYPKGKRLRYERAAEWAQHNRVTKKQATCTMFVKREKMNPWCKRNPDPRAIQFRDARYCVELARYLKPIEHNLYVVRGSPGSGYPQTRMVGKGLNQVERAMLLMEKLRRFRDPRIVSLDASRFDKHVSRELLEIEHSVYLLCNSEPRFAELLHMQLDNLVRSALGLTYKCRGRRMSGDMNTALGNCILMLIMVSAFMTRGGMDYDVFDDGDDCLLIVEEEHLGWVTANCHAEFLEFGMEIKVEGIATRLEEVEWCQSKPLEYAPGKWKFVRDWRKVLSHDLVGSKWLGNAHCRPRLLHTIGVCELVLNMGVPILQEYSLALIRNARGAKCLSFDRSPLWHRVKHEIKLFGKRRAELLHPKPVTDEARVSFSMAFGVDVEEQLMWEELLRSWSFTCGNNEVTQPFFDVAAWCETRLDRPERADWLSVPLCAYWQKV